MFNIIDAKDMKYIKKITLKEINKSEYACRSHFYNSLTFTFFFPFLYLIFYSPLLISKCHIYFTF